MSRVVQILKMRNLGAIKTNIRTVTATTTVTADDSILCVQNGGANITINLPSAASSKGRLIIIKRYTASTGTVTIQAVSGGGNIEALEGTFGATTTLAAIGSRGSQVGFMSDGTVWHRLFN